MISHSVADRPLPAIDTPALLEPIREMLAQLRLTEAEASASQLIEQDRTCIAAYTLLGKALYAQGRRFEAERFLTRAYCMDRAEREAGLELLAVLRDIGRDDLGSMAAAEMIERYPLDEDVSAFHAYFQAELKAKAEPGFWMQFFEEGDTVFDVGANVGEMTEQFLQEGAGKVVAFDPQPSSIRALQARFDGRREVAIVPTGLSAHPGKLMFHISNSGTGLSTFSNAWRGGRYAAANWDERIEVEVTTLDEMIVRFGRPAFCKIDVEGYELQVLEGLTQPLPCLSIEFAQEFLLNTARCLQRLERIGFDRFNAVIGEGRRLLCGEWVAPDRLLRLLQRSPDALLRGDIYARSTV